MNRTLRASCVALLALCCLTPRAGADDWPQWRGPDRTGHVPAGVPVPAALPAGGPKVVWQVPVGFGLASPVVAGGTVLYLDEHDNKEYVHAVNAATGGDRWAAPLDEAHKDSQSAAGPRCTPLIDEDRAYAQSCRGELRCLSLSDGALRWRANYVKDFGAVYVGEKGQAQGAARHGYDGSPLVDGGQLIALAGGVSDGAVVCFDKLTGTVAWKSAQGGTPGYAPPIIATIGGVRQVVCFMVDGVWGVDRADGKLLWQFPVKTTFARHVTTPLVLGDTVVVSSHQVGLIGIRVTKAADGAFKAEQAYVSKELAINFSSPVAVGDHLYGVGPSKNLICVDIPSGKLAWSKDNFFTTAGGKAHAGLVVMGENVLILTDDGQLVLLAADPKAYRELGRAQACGTNWCNPAYAGGKLYLRDAKELKCLALMP